MASELNIYIPRMLANVNQKMIKQVFQKMDIGKVHYIDMHRRINENKNMYYFAFVSMKLFDTEKSNLILNKLNRHGSMRFYYEKNSDKYWEIKKHIDRSMRNKNKDSDDDDKKKRK